MHVACAEVRVTQPGGGWGASRLSPAPPTHTDRAGLTGQLSASKYKIISQTDQKSLYQVASKESQLLSLTLEIKKT